MGREVSMSGFAMKTAGCSLTGMPRDEVVRQIRNDYSCLRIRACSHVRFWHKADIAIVVSDARFRG